MKNKDEEKPETEAKYVPPEIKIVDVPGSLEDFLGPSINCSGFGGAVTGC